MSENERHTMQLVATHGEYEEWFCPICGRRFVMSWPPNFHRTILEPGDENVIHTGGKQPFGKFMDISPHQLIISQTEEKPGTLFGFPIVETDDLDDEPLPPEFEEWLKGREK